MYDIIYILNVNKYRKPTLSMSFVYIYAIYAMYSSSCMCLQSPPEFNYYVPFINTTDIRRAIHVGALSYGSNAEKVEIALGNVRSVFYYNCEVLDPYKSHRYV